MASGKQARRNGARPSGGEAALLSLGGDASRLLDAARRACRLQTLIRGFLVLFLATAVYFGGEALLDRAVSLSATTRAGGLSAYGVLIFALAAATSGSS